MLDEVIEASGTVSCTHKHVFFVQMGHGHGWAGRGLQPINAQWHCFNENQRFTSTTRIPHTS